MEKIAQLNSPLCPPQTIWRVQAGNRRQIAKTSRQDFDLAGMFP
jgi:hypothetical protein